MTNYKPSDLVLFTHIVPPNVPVPDGMEFAFRNTTGVVCGPVVAKSNTLWREYMKRWTKTPLKPILPTRCPGYITDVTVRFYWTDEDEYEEESYDVGILGHDGTWNLYSESGVHIFAAPETIHDFKLAKLVVDGDDDD